MLRALQRMQTLRARPPRPGTWSLLSGAREEHPGDKLERERDRGAVTGDAVERPGEGLIDHKHELGRIAQWAHALVEVPEWNEICAPALIEFTSREDSELG